MRARTLLAGVLLLPAATVQAEICYSDPHDATVAVAPTSATPFNCPMAGRRTLPQLAASGYVVVKLSPLVVGQAGPTTQSAQQLVIELPTRVFRHGFEQGG